MEVRAVSSRRELLLGSSSTYPQVERLSPPPPASNYTHLCPHVMSLQNYHGTTWRATQGEMSPVE